MGYFHLNLRPVVDFRNIRSNLRPFLWALTIAAATAATILATAYAAFWLFQGLLEYAEHAIGR